VLTLVFAIAIRKYKLRAVLQNTLIAIDATPLCEELWMVVLATSSTTKAELFLKSIYNNA